MLPEISTEDVERVGPIVSLAWDRLTDGLLADDRVVEKKVVLDPDSLLEYKRGNLPLMRLRMDWEDSSFEMSKDLKEFPSIDRKTMDLMGNMCRTDLVDLIVNGDTNSGDVVLRMYDGEKKLDKRLVDFNFVEGSLFRQFKPMKNTIEYTLYILVKADYEV